VFPVVRGRLFPRGPNAGVLGLIVASRQDAVILGLHSIREFAEKAVGNYPHGDSCN